MRLSREISLVSTLRIVDLESGLITLEVIVNNYGKIIFATTRRSDLSLPADCHLANDSKVTTTVVTFHRSVRKRKKHRMCTNMPIPSPVQYFYVLLHSHTHKVKYAKYILFSLRFKLIFRCEWFIIAHFALGFVMLTSFKLTINIAHLIAKPNTCT